mgnify:CR=1 FL=1
MGRLARESCSEQLADKVAEVALSQLTSIDNCAIIDSYQKAMIGERCKVPKRMHYPREIMLLCVRWYAAYPLSRRHIKGMMQELAGPLLLVDGRLHVMPQSITLMSNSPTSTIARGLVGQTSTRGRSSSKATRHFWPSQSSVAVC